MSRELIDLNGIVIKSTRYAERDFLLEVLSAERGRVFIYAKNSTKTNKNTMFAGVFSLSKFELATGNDGRLIYTGSKMIEYFPELRKDPYIMVTGQYFCEISTYIPENTDNPQAYLSLLLNSLYLLTGRTSVDLETAKVKLAFEIGFLHLSGLMPYADYCSSCGQRPCYWHFDEGFLCSECAEKYHSNKLYSINDTMLHAINHIMNSNGISRYAFNMSKKSFDSLQWLLEEYIQYKLETQLKTLDIYRTLNVD